MRIVILSHKRPDRVYTLKNFPERIRKLTTIFVEPGEELEYARHNDCEIVSFKERSKSIANARNKVLEHYRKIGERYVLMCDDDIQQLFKRSGLTKGGHPKLKKIGQEEVGKLIDYMAELIKSEKIAQVSISYKQNNWYCSGKYELDKGCFCFVMHDLKHIGNYDENCHLFEDTDRSLDVINRGFRTVLLYTHAFGTVTMSKNQGGLKEFYDSKASQVGPEVTAYLQKNIQTI